MFLRTCRNQFRLKAPVKESLISIHEKTYFWFLKTFLLEKISWIRQNLFSNTYFFGQKFHYLAWSASLCTLWCLWCPCSIFKTNLALILSQSGQPKWYCRSISAKPKCIKKEKDIPKLPENYKKLYQYFRLFHFHSYINIAVICHCFYM